MAEINSPEVTEQGTEFISYFIISKAGGLEMFFSKKKKTNQRSFYRELSNDLLSHRNSVY